MNAIFKYISNQKPDAVAKVAGGSDYPQIFGTVQFYGFSNGVLVVCEIENLPKTLTNIFAFHIHDGNNCDDNFSMSGSHYNPTSAPHPNHAGDMPPLFSNDGSAFLAFFTNRITIDEILGKVVIIHDNPDDFTTQPAGNSGTKIACGKIVKYS